MNDTPPSYEVVMGFDIPPPAYHTIVIEQETSSKGVAVEVEKCPKFLAIQHI